MKNLKSKILIVTVLFLGFSACDQDILDSSPTDQISDAAVWEDEALIELYLYDIYERMRHGLAGSKLSSLVDDTHFIHDQGTAAVVQGTVSPSNLAAWSRADLDHYRWNHLYSAIRQTNIILENIDEANVDESFKSVVKGETHFLRAFFYHNLVRMYGGVPIITEAYELDDDLEVARNTFEDGVDFVVQEADRAAALLLEEPRELGLATKGAALALKSRILYHAAGDLFDDPIGPNPELTGYTSGSQQARYQRAKEAALEVMNMGKYELFNRYPEDPAYNYEQIFLINDDHEETIMNRYFVPSRDWQDIFVVNLVNGPNGYRGWAGNTPLQSLVDAYEMDDGTEFDWSNPEHAEKPFENREPRFYASILYDGAPFIDPPSFREPYDLDGIIQTFRSLTLPDGSTVAGVDTRNGPIEDWNGSYSGYYMRKFIDSTIPLQERQQSPWPVFRYTEVLMNYAEACIGLGEEEEARRVLNMIRERAGMPDITESGEALVQLYRKERRIELFGEDSRFFDVRRWKIAPEVYHDALGISVTAEATDRSDRSTYTNFTYDPTRHVQDRNWHDGMYFSPIPLDEMNRNAQLIQNPGY